jgi:hypothetical protein
VSVSLKHRAQFFDPAGREIGLSRWRRHAAWLRQFPWQVRVIIILLEITAAYVCFVFGIFLGAAFMG